MLDGFILVLVVFWCVTVFVRGPVGVLVFEVHL